MADAVEVYLDISSPQGALVKGLSDQSAPSFGPFYQGQTIKFRIYPVISTGATFTGPFYSKVSLTGLDFQMVAGPRAGAESIKAAQYSWTKQSTADSEGKSGYFYADFDLNTTEMNTLLATADTITTFIEFRLSRSGGNYTPVHQREITVLSVVKDPSGAASNPTPAPSYYTRLEIDNLFVLFNNALKAANNGKTIILTSPDGSRTREIGVGNDGAPIDNLT